LSAYLLALHDAPGLNLNFRSESCSVRLCAFYAYGDPVLLVAAVVPQQLRAPFLVHDEDIDVAIIVVVCESCASTDIWLLKSRAAERTRLVESVLGVLLSEKKILHRHKMPRVFVILKCPAVHDKEIDLAVIVIIKK
jgi:hypothetical protein